MSEREKKEANECLSVCVRVCVCLCVVYAIEQELTARLLGRLPACLLACLIRYYCYLIVCSHSTSKVAHHKTTANMPHTQTE